MATNQLLKIENWVVFKVLVKLKLTFYPPFCSERVLAFFPF